MTSRRDFILGGGAAFAALSFGLRPALGVSPALPIAIDPGGQLTQGGWLRGRVAPGIRTLTLDGQPVPFASDGRFLIAFDRDSGPAAQLLAVHTNGKSFTQPLTISPRGWQIEHINAARRPGGITDENYARLRKAELARISAARRIETNAQGWRQDFIRPAPGRFSGRFGSQRIYRGVPGSYHSGLDIAGGANTPYVAPADGVVILAASAPFSLEGNLLMIDHGMGLNSAFLHSAQLLVKEGDAVTRGQQIGRIGATGRATGPHLHWSIKWNERRLDPLLMLPVQPTPAAR